MLLGFWIVGGVSGFCWKRKSLSEMERSIGRLLVTMVASSKFPPPEHCSRPRELSLCVADAAGVGYYPGPGDLCMFSLPFSLSLSCALSQAHHPHPLRPPTRILLRTGLTPDCTICKSWLVTTLAKQLLINTGQSNVPFLLRDSGYAQSSRRVPSCQGRSGHCSSISAPLYRVHHLASWAGVKLPPCWC